MCAGFRAKSRAAASATNVLRRTRTKGIDSCGSRPRWRNRRPDLVQFLSETGSGRLARTDFSFVFRNALRKRTDVSAKLRLALSRYFQPALAARQPGPLLATRLRDSTLGTVYASVRRIFTTPFENGLATRCIRELRRFYCGNCRTGLYVSCCAAAHARCVRSLAAARISRPFICHISRGGNVVWLLVRVEKPSAKRVCSAIVLDMVVRDAVAVGRSFI